MRALLALCLCLCSLAVFADSISVSIKPARGLSGTASFNIHQDGAVTMLVYNSPTTISESTLNIEPRQTEALRLLSLQALNSYLNTGHFESFEQYRFSLSIAHTVDGVTKNVSTKRMNDEALRLLDNITKLTPGGELDYLAEQM